QRLILKSGVGIKAFNFHSSARFLPSGASDIVLGFGLILTIALIATSLLGYFLFHHAILFHDEWAFYSQRLAPFSQQPLWQRIWALRYGHRLVFPALIQKDNWLWFHADLANLIAINVFALTVSAWLLTRLVTAELVSRFGRWFLTALILALLLWLGNAGVNWGFGLTNTLLVLGVVASCYCMYRCAGLATGRCGLWLAGALAFAVLASLSYGSGVVIWPV